MNDTGVLRSGFLTVLTLAPLCICQLALSQPTARSQGEREGVAQFIHRAEVIHDRDTNQLSGRHLWPLYSSPEARMNYFEVTSRTGLHYHPDADHKLYVLEGSLIVTAGTNSATATVGDFIIIPRGVRHCYDVPAKGQRALLLTFDAPPYDPRKTVNLEPLSAREPAEPPKQAPEK